jgi:hypothetical protein
MLEKMRLDREHPPAHEPEHAHESLLQKAGWVTPPPPPPLHEGLLQKIGLASSPPPLAPKPEGIFGHHHHEDAAKEEHGLAHKLSGLGLTHEPPKEEHGLGHTLSGMLGHKEEEKPGFVRKISDAIVGEKKEEGAF